MEHRSTEEARRDFAALMEDVLRGHHFEITRYGRPVAALVPIEWVERAKAALGEPPLDLKGEK